jgi:hypothetical protein
VGETDLDGDTYRFFDFDDLKPGDYGEDTISLHVNDNNAFLCADVTLTSNEENGINEPEGEADQTSGPGEGELADLVQFLWWADDGDNVLEEGEDLISDPGAIGSLPLGEPFPLALADSDENIWTGEGGPVDGGETYHIGKAWCFGDIGSDPLPQSDYSGPDADNDDDGTAGDPGDGGVTCDGASLGNESQTDTLTADISFDAVQARHNDGFQCKKTPTFSECSLGEQYADAAGIFDQGTQKGGAAVLANRSLPAAAFGAPQTSGAASDVGFPVGSFVSLGFKQNGPDNGSLVLDFSDNVVLDGPGNDLKVYEVTGGTYPDEKVRVAVSQDNITYFTVAASITRDGEVDIAPSGLPWARYVKLTDVSDPALFASDADGYDLDALEALNCGVPAN